MSGAPEMTLLEVLRRTAEFLKSKGCDSPRLEAELLLAKGLGVKRLDLYLQFDRPLFEEDLAKCRDLVRRRGAREPMAYILGEREFRSLTFEVNPDVFIPRPDTETLVDEVLLFLRKEQLQQEQRGEYITIADIGTGSGCLVISIAHAMQQIKALATDISNKALAVAARNAERHGVAARIEFLESQYLQNVPPGRTFDVIVSNPPYVLSTEIPQLQPELRFEPTVALSPPKDAVADVFDNLAKTAAARLSREGAVFIEIGEGQAPIAEASFAAAGFTNFRRAKDLSGADRVVSARR